MSRIRKNLPLLIILVFTLALAAPTLAAPTAQQACTGDVSGTVVAVDGNVVTIEYVTDETTGETAQCTVTLAEKSYDHPIVALLGEFFDNVDAEALEAELAAALEEAASATMVCAVYTPPAEGETEGTWTWVPSNPDGSCPESTKPGTVSRSDGNLIFKPDDDTLPTDPLSFEDEAAANAAKASIQKALDALMVEWSVNDDGTLTQAGDEIQAYHDGGIGFGVLVKLYAMADKSQAACLEDQDSNSNGDNGVPQDDCGVTVDELVGQFTSGIGIGQLFKEYGKPSMTGVGHVRKAAKDPSEPLNNDENDELAPEEQLKSNNGPELPAQANGLKDKPKIKIKKNDRQSPAVCNPAGKSNGKGKGKAKGLSKCK